MIKISIVVPVYNIDKYLNRCLDSLVRQTYQNIEIILINDGSTDNSPDICRKYEHQDKRVKVVSQKNQGLSDARNHGIKLAKGDFVFFVDGDDWLDYDCIEKCVNYLDSSVDILMMPYIREYGKKSHITAVFDENYAAFEKEQIKARLIRRLVGPVGEELNKPNRMEDLNSVWNKIYNMELVRDRKFVDTRIIGTEDLWFNLLVMAQARKIIFIKSTCYHYNKTNDTSLTRKFNKYQFEGWKRLYTYIRTFINKEAAGEMEFQQALNNRIVINLLALSRNIVISGMSRAEKLEELEKVLEDDIYKEAFVQFEWDKLTKIWKIFYKCCRDKKATYIYYMILFAEKIKRYVK